MRTLGLSEVSAATMRKAHAVHPIAAVQNEYSLWTRNPEIAALDTCRELGIAFVAFSPVARGFLCDASMTWAASTPRTSAAPCRASTREPRAQPGAAAAVQGAGARGGLHAGAACAGLAAAQGATHRADPGHHGVAHLKENLAAADVRLAPELIARLDALINQKTVAGNRYGEQANREVDTEVFPD